jgi:hypothetical protein
VHPPYHKGNRLSTGKIPPPERKDVDKIGPFQIDKNDFPTKMDGSQQEGVREAWRAVISPGTIVEPL